MFACKHRKRNGAIGHYRSRSIDLSAAAPLRRSCSLVHTATRQAARQLLIRDYDLPPIEFGLEYIHVLHDDSGRKLDDIRSLADNAVAADAVTEHVRTLTADPDSALHVSIAGGRKTMGYYLGLGSPLNRTCGEHYLQGRSPRAQICDPCLLDGHQPWFQPIGTRELFNDPG